MDSLLSQIYYGNLPAGVDAKVTDPEYPHLCDLFDKKESELTNVLAVIRPDLAESARRLLALQNELSLMEHSAAFQRGLSMGLIIFSEALKNVKNA